MLSSKDPAEIVTLTFDFSALTTTVTAFTIAISRIGGAADAAPLSMLSGSGSIVGAKVLQKIIGGVDGATYDVKCTADAADGSRYALADLLAVAAA
jgi:TRAP-type uncharacterized transport system substrate-binding protein